MRLFYSHHLTAVSPLCEGSLFLLVKCGFWHIGAVLLRDTANRVPTNMESLYGNFVSGHGKTSCIIRWSDCCYSTVSGRNVISCWIFTYLFCHF